MKAERNKGTFPGHWARASGQNSAFWHQDQYHIHFTIPCLHVNAFLFSSQNETDIWGMVTLPLLFPQEKGVLGWEEGGALWCFDDVHLSFWVSLFSCTSWWLFCLFDCYFLISLIDSWFSPHPSYSIRLGCLRPPCPHQPFIPGDTQIIHSQSFFPWLPKPVGHASVFPQ